MTDVEHADVLIAQYMEVLKDNFGDRIENYAFPPPVFLAMEARFVEVDRDAGILGVRFPVLERYLNPYGSMQGGMVAAAIDNTLGPLRVLIAPPNVTRRLEITYSRPVMPDMGFIIVRARLIERADPRLRFQADVRSPGGQRLARARALHWIVEGVDL
jgi:acyl-coenzyme A thioesterase PaaI-like protein